RITTQAKTRSVAEKEIARVEKVLRERAGKYMVGSEEETVEQHIVRLMTEQKKFLATAESCTGGLIAEKITACDGASSMFRGGVVAYHNDIKSGIIKVRPQTIDKFGAVS